MSFTTFQQRKQAILKIADDMAAAASSMSPQNYDTLMNCREDLRCKVDAWIQEANDRHELLNKIKTQLNEVDIALKL